jgi:hypothetical protein
MQSDTDRGLSFSLADAPVTLVISAYLVILFTLVEVLLKCHEPLRVIQCSVYEVQMYACDRYSN